MLAASGVRGLRPQTTNAVSVQRMVRVAVLVQNELAVTAAGVIKSAELAIAARANKIPSAIFCIVFIT